MAFERFEVLPTREALAKYTSQLVHKSVSESLNSLLASQKSVAKTAIVEHDYIDVDYSASYYEQRGRSFTPSERGTTRLHFFSETFTKRQLVNASQSTVRKMGSNYLGFSVVRPDHPSTLGRTFLACPSTISGRLARFPTRSDTLVDLAGIALKVESCPYMSQDHKIMACATAALWMSTSPLSKKIPGVTSNTTAEITGMAMSLNRPFGPVIGRRGLTVLEMEQALLEIGFDPRIFSNPQPDELVGICHLLTDSGIPPILAIESGGDGHAVTVVGYTLETPDCPQSSLPGIFSAHQFVSNLILHDDLRGMYLLAKVKPSSNTSPGMAELSIEVAGRTDQAICAAILVPFPRRVMLDAFEVQGQAEEWIGQAKKRRWIEDRDVIYRTILVRSNVFKQTLLGRQDRGSATHGYPKDLVGLARSLPMPRYIWLIEVSYGNEDQWDPSNPTLPKVIADFVLDSTSTETMRPDYMMLHFPGVVLGRRVTEDRIDPVFHDIPQDHPHPPFPDIPRP